MFIEYALSYTKLASIFIATKRNYYAKIQIIIHSIIRFNTFE